MPKKNKTMRKKLKAPMEITTTSNKPFQKLNLDVIGPLPITENGNRFAVTMQDDLTKLSQAYPVPNHESKTIAKCLLHFISHYGIPTTILSDQGSDFLSELMKEFAKLFHIKKLKTTAFHPQSNGALERSHSTLKDYLKHYTNHLLNDWDDWLPTAMFSYNTTIHSSTNYSPYELVFGYRPSLPSALTQPLEVSYTYDNYIDQLKYRLNKSWEIAQDHLKISKEKSKQYYDKNINNPEYKIGDHIYLQNKKTRLAKKLSTNYLGPYEITKIGDKQTVYIKVKNKVIKVHKNLIKPVVR